MMLDWFRRLFQLPPGASSFAAGVDALHAFVIGASLVGACGIALTLVAYLVRYRERTPGSSTPRLVVSSKREALLVGGILGLFLVWWVLGYRQYLHMRRAPPGANTIYVTAKQWMWKFAHENGMLENDMLTLPVGVPVQLIATSRDVIHSLYVPAFRVKQDVLPGRYLSLWFEPTQVGTFAIECAEYC
ncbi:MAG TPA: cytochrome c oxidase subunit II, partial [Polyangiaceae bacterium]